MPTPTTGLPQYVSHSKEGLWHGDAGTAFTGEGQSLLPTGTAMGITTGAPIPSNADAVAPHEQVEFRNATLILRHPIRLATAFFLLGKMCARQKRTLVERGTVLNATIFGSFSVCRKSPTYTYIDDRMSTSSALGASL